MNRLPILIVGAGPTGLMLACELARHNITFRIIDKKSEPVRTSNATLIQARSLEMLDAIGIVDDFLRIGHRCDTIHFYIKGKVVATIPLKYLNSAYSYVLMLSQRETEHLLTKKLAQANIHVERSYELIDLKQVENGVISTVQLPNGDIERIMTEFVVGCDGANSAVRNKCQFSFPGKEISEQFMVADALMSSFLSPHQIHIFCDRGTTLPNKNKLFSAFPWGEKAYRLSANLYLSHPRKSFTEHEVKDIVAERTYGHYVVESISWISPFWIHCRMVDSMQQNAIFLAGDAAHLHSPVGGQEMNTGLQDACNLGWKLALVVQRKAKRALLDTYQVERFSAIRKIVSKTEHLTNMILFDRSFLSKLKKFGKDVRDITSATCVAKELTQLAVNYPESSIINFHQKAAAEAPQQGERVPDIKLKNGRTFYSYLRHGQHHVLIFVVSNEIELQVTKVHELRAMLNNQFPDLFKTLVISHENLSAIEKVLVDESGELHNIFAVKQAATYVIRPDNFIAYFAAGIDVSALEEFIRRGMAFDSIQ